MSSSRHCAIETSQNVSARFPKPRHFQGKISVPFCIKNLHFFEDLKKHRKYAATEVLISKVGKLPKTI
jgi:hypothetical protein